MLKKKKMKNYEKKQIQFEFIHFFTIKNGKKSTPTEYFIQLEMNFAQLEKLVE